MHHGPRQSVTDVTVTGLAQGDDSDAMQSESKASNSDNENNVEYLSDSDDAKQETVVTKSKSRRSKNGKSGSGAGSGSSTSWMGSPLMEIYRQLRSLSSEYKVEIDVPELAFFGFQSAGKTSILSLLARWPCGTMKSQIGTRCPVRFDMRYDESREKAGKTNPLIKVGTKSKGMKKVMDYIALSNAIEQHMEILENSEHGFSSEILEVSIESYDVPTLIFVDLPGLMMNESNETHKKWKEEIEKITAEFVTMTNGSSSSYDISTSYKYIPVWVQACKDIENSSNEEFDIIDGLLSPKRPNWTKDVFCVFNKFDGMTNNKAEGIASYIDQIRNILCVNGDDMVITSSNPYRVASSTLTPKQLFGHIQSLPEKEAKWWRKLINTKIGGKAQPGVKKLESRINKYCGLNLMRSKLMDKMCNIVEKTLPQLETKLQLTQARYEQDMNNLRNQLSLVNPTEIRRKVDSFHHEFLTLLAGFQTNRLGLPPGVGEQTFEEEMTEFYASEHYENYKSYRINMLNTKYSREMQYYSSFFIKPDALKSELEYMKQDSLVKDLTSKRIGSGAIKRTFDLWTVMIGLMPFPDYDDEYIHNAGHHFDATEQGYAWKNIRNIVSRSSFLFLDACSWLAEYLRYRLKKNADLVYDQLVHTERLGNGGRKDESMEKLYYIGVRDYKKFVDRLSNEFKGAIKMLPSDLGAILDKQYHESYLNFGNFLLSTIETHRLIANFGTHSKQNLKQRAKEQEKFEKQSKENAERMVHHDRHGTMTRRYAPRSVTAITNAMSENGSESKLDVLSDDDDHEIGAPAKTIAASQNKTEEEILSIFPYVNFKRDHDFYNAVYPCTFDRPFIDIDPRQTDLIKKMCQIYWNYTKKQVIMLTKRLATNRVLKQVQADMPEPRRAVQNGVDWPAIQELLYQVSKLTQIEQPNIEEFILKNTKRKFEISVDRMENEQLLAAYGIDREKIKQEYDLLSQEYEKFQLKRDETNAQIQKLIKKDSQAAEQANNLMFLD